MKNRVRNLSDGATATQRQQHLASSRNQEMNNVEYRGNQPTARSRSRGTGTSIDNSKTELSRNSLAGVSRSSDLLNLNEYNTQDDKLLISMPISPMFLDVTDVPSWNDHFGGRGATCIPGPRIKSNVSLENDSFLPGLLNPGSVEDKLRKPLFSRDNQQSQRTSRLPVNNELRLQQHSQQASSNPKTTESASLPSPSVTSTGFLSPASSSMSLSPIKSYNKQQNSNTTNDPISLPNDNNSRQIKSTARSKTAQDTAINGLHHGITSPTKALPQDKMGSFSKSSPDSNNNNNNNNNMTSDDSSEHSYLRGPKVEAWAYKVIEKFHTEEYARPVSRCSSRFSKHQAAGSEPRKARAENRNDLDFPMPTTESIRKK